MFKKILFCVKKDYIVNDAKSVAKIFNEYLTRIASDIGFSDPITDDNGKDEVLISLIVKYDNHPSIIAIESAVSSGTRDIRI